MILKHNNHKGLKCITKCSQSIKVSVKIMLDKETLKNYSKENIKERSKINMKLIDKIFTIIATASVMLGIASIESTPIIIPVLMIVGGGAWLIYESNAYKWE